MSRDLWTAPYWGFSVRTSDLDLDLDQGLTAFKKFIFLKASLIQHNYTNDFILHKS